MIRFQGVEKSFRGPDGAARAALAGFDLQVAEGETVCLIGKSGCGKSTALRLVNRLLEPDAGSVSVGGVDVAEQDPIRLRRGIGYVLQHGGLLPHLDVAANVALLCRLEGWDGARATRRAHELLELVRLEPAEFARRYPHELSGGQRQRVGVARALALDPPVILMDEPFGALDALTRRELQDELVELSAGLAKTLLVVTHDLGEAFRLGDRVALMEAGRLVQEGRRSDFEDDPANERVAALFGHDA